MYICIDCGALFLEPREYIESHGLDSPPYEAYSGCPVCGGSFAETYECDGCGQYVCGEYIELNDKTVICSNCYEIKNIEDDVRGRWSW